jgi:hypothetical protein
MGLRYGIRQLETLAGQLMICIAFSESIRL